MKIMVTWITLEELDGAGNRQEYKGRGGQFLARKLNYWQPFGFHLRYLHQVDDHNNRRCATISIEITWATKLWTNIKFTWYLAVTGVNTALADGHFCKGGKSIPTLRFCRKLVH